MRSGLFSLMIAGCGVSACSPAYSSALDSKNPAHCIAAFNYGAYWFKIGHDDRRVRNMYVRGAYEMEKWKATGRDPKEALVEGKNLTRRYVRDPGAMMQLFQQCGSAQDADPEFREAQPRIIA